MSLLIELALWLGMSLLAAVLVGRRSLAITALASAGAAFACGSMVRAVDGHGWSTSDIDLLAVVAAGVGAMLGAMAMRALLDAMPQPREHRHYDPTSSSAHRSGP